MMPRSLSLLLRSVHHSIVLFSGTLFCLKCGASSVKFERQVCDFLDELTQEHLMWPNAAVCWQCVIARWWSLVLEVTSDMALKDWCDALPPNSCYRVERLCSYFVD